jgi:hypothetical protein
LGISSRLPNITSSPLCCTKVNSLGRKFVQFTTRNSSRHFSVHEDLLCANSRVFKTRLQKDRKKIEGECAICHEDLNSSKADVTFCRASCGQNVHEKCMEQWIAMPGPTKCPLCQKSWRQDVENLIALDDELDTDAVQTYLDWLYMGTLHFSVLERHSNEFDISILEAWRVATVIQDIGFQQALAAEHITDVQSGINPGFMSTAIEYAFGEEGTKTMRKFVIDMFLAEGKSHVADFLDYHGQKLPNLFLSQIGATVLRVENMPTIEEVLDEHTGGQYEIQKDADVDTDDE